MKPWIRFLFKNTLRLFSLLVCVSIVAFALVSLSPIDPLQANVGQAALGSMSAEQIAKLHTYWGSDTPAVQRYATWALDFLRGDMGVSLLYRQNVSTVLAQKLANSLLLMTSAWVISGVLGFILGILAGLYRGTWLDKLVQSYALLTASTPTFWLALVLLLVFGVWLQVLPIGLSVPIGLDAASVTLLDKLRHAILPTLVLSITGIANIALHTREKMAEIMDSEYVLFARARGESNAHIVWHHALRNVLLPAITLQFAAISEIFGGSILVEQVFSYPGLGQAAVAAGLGGDVPMLLAITVISAAIVFGGNFIANVLYGIVDPRMKKEVL